MSSTFTVTQMANILAGGSATQDEVALLHRQIRIFHKKGFLPSDNVKDARGTAEFNIASLYRARVLSALVAAGFDSDTGIFRAAVDAMSAFPIGNFPATNGISHGGLRDSISGVAAGDPWLLSFAHQTPYLHGVRGYTATFHRKDDTESVAQSPLEGLSLTTVFRGEIDLNAIFADLPALAD